MQRRTFLAACSAMACSSFVSAEEPPKYRVGVIGHTGRGNYGHGLDTVWKEIPETEIVAVADANPAGLWLAQQRLSLKHGFADYRKMLTNTQPDIVAICPRHPDQHRDFAIAAIEAGVKGIYIEKPFCRSPAEADEIVAACEKHNTKLAVAHRNRYHPALPAIQKMIDSGEIGQVLEIRGRGKGDRRGGAEDLWVLGSHVLNLIHYFGGKPLTCSAVLLKEGERATKEDIHHSGEALGPLAGNELHARYRMENGFTAYFDSIANDGTNSAGFGLQIIGNKGLIDINCDQFPIAYLVPGNPFAPTSKPRPWLPISSAGADKPEPEPNLRHLVGHHITPVKDLLDAIQEDRPPLCSAKDGATTVEMICAAFASHVQSGKEVRLPLENRENALGML